MNAPPRRPGKFPLRMDQLAPAASGAPVVAPTTAVPRAVLRPQAVVHHAAGTARRSAAPSGIGLDSIDVRRRMVERLRALGLGNEALLAAFLAVPRHHFVDAALITQAYEDTSLPIGHGQTISKPSVVGRMIELLLHGASARASGQLGRVLEIGSGCGYQAALLCRLGTSVVSVERVRALHDKARELTAPLRMNQLRLVYGDGMLGHAPRAPYDSIIAAASGDALPEAWLAQLAVGGRLIAPVTAGTAPGAPARQVLVVVDRSEHGFERRVHEAVQFVPLKSGSA